MSRRRLPSRKRRCSESTRSVTRRMSSSSAKISMGFRLDVSMTASAEERPFPLAPPPRPLPPLSSNRDRSKHNSQSFELDKLKPPPPLPPSIFGPNGSLLRHCSRKGNDRSAVSLKLPPPPTPTTRAPIYHSYKMNTNAPPPAAIPFMPPPQFLSGGKSVNQVAPPFWPHAAALGAAGLIPSNTTGRRRGRRRSSRRKTRSRRSPSCSTCSSSFSDSGSSSTGSSTYCCSSRSCSESCSSSSASDRYRKSRHQRHRGRTNTKKRPPKRRHVVKEKTRKRRHQKSRQKEESNESGGEATTAKIEEPVPDECKEHDDDQNCEADAAERPSTGDEEDDELRVLAERKRELLKQLAQLEENEKTSDLEESSKVD